MNEFETPEQIAADIARMYSEDETTWIKGVWARNAEGYTIWPTSATAVCWCLRGAIAARLPESLWPHLDNPKARLSKDVCRAFDEALGYPPGDELHFVRWNDEPQRTVTEVIGLCQKVAKIGEGFAVFRAAALQ